MGFSGPAFRAVALAAVMSLGLSAQAQSAANGGQPPRRMFQSVGSLDDQAAYQRAFEAVLWAMPAASAARIRAGLLAQPGMADNVIDLFSGPLHSAQQLLTADPITPYILAVSDLRKGPVVLVVPAKTGNMALDGQILDAWQATLANVGQDGADKGAGGKFLLLPPDYDGAVPGGYVAIRSDTYRILFTFHALPLPGATPADADAYTRTLQLYPLADAASPPPTKFVDGRKYPLHTLPFYDLRALETIRDIVSTEPVPPRDTVMMGMLASIGVVPGQPFNPPASMKPSLQHGVADAYYYLQEQASNLFAGNLYRPDSHWGDVILPDAQHGFRFEGDNSIDIDRRATAWFFSAFYPQTLPDQPATAYLTPVADDKGNALQAGKDYVLHVPADMQAQSWSLAVYDRANWAFIANAFDRTQLGSLDKDRLKMNPDGSVDIYFGQTAPKGLDSNWIPTLGETPFVLLRLNGPNASFWSKSLEMPDVQLVVKQGRPGAPPLDPAGA